MAEKTKGREARSSKGQKDKERSWCSDRMLAVFSSREIEKHSEAALLLFRERKVLDFLIAPGRVSAKVLDNGGRPPQMIELRFAEFSEDAWEKIFSALSSRALYMAKILAGQFPIELEEALASVSVSLFPERAKEVSILVNSRLVSGLSRLVLAVLYKLCETLDTAPFSIFSLRGRGRDEVIVEISKRRNQVRDHFSPSPAWAGRPIPFEPAPPLVETLEHYFSAGKALSALSYSLRADELPASVLRRLDFLPLGGLEDKVDTLLEEAYVRVARRAQAFGLGLD